MTYNVFGGTLKLSQLQLQLHHQGALEHRPGRSEAVAFHASV